MGSGMEWEGVSRRLGSSWRPPMPWGVRRQRRPPSALVVRLVRLRSARPLRVPQVPPAPRPGARLLTLPGRLRAQAGAARRGRPIVVVAAQASRRLHPRGLGGPRPRPRGPRRRRAARAARASRYGGRRPGAARADRGSKERGRAGAREPLPSPSHLHVVHDVEERRPALYHALRPLLPLVQISGN